MKTIGIVVMTAVAILATGCGNSKQLETELATANARIGALDSTLAAVRTVSMMESAQVYNLQQDVAALANERDDLQGFVADTKAQVARLNSDLRKSRLTYRQELDSLKGVNTALAIDINTVRAEIDNADIRLVASERRINDLIRARDSVYAFVDQIEPWFAYYKQEARRNWFKKLFKAGDAVKPANVEPSFGTPGPASELEALKP